MVYALKYYDSQFQIEEITNVYTISSLDNDDIDFNHLFKTRTNVILLYLPLISK